MRSFRIQHIAKPVQGLKPIAPYLAVAGDASHDFLQYASETWKHVYHLSETLSEFDNVTALHRKKARAYAHREHVGIVGCSLRNPALNRHFYEQRAAVESGIAYFGYLKIPTVVLSDVAPSYNLISSRYIGDEDAVAVNVDYLMKPPVAAWIYGGMHTNVSGMYNNTYVACNGDPLGLTAPVEFMGGAADYDGPNPELVHAATRN
jgi:hypothetical protein